MGCANGSASSAANAMPQAVNRQPGNGGGGFVELGVELPNKLVGKDAALYRLFKLPNNIARDTVPSMLEKFLTPQAWTSICAEVKSQEWEFNTGDQLGSALAEKLAMQYKPLKVSFKKDVYYESVKRAANGGMDILVFKIVIDTGSAEPPAQPMTGEPISAEVPSSNKLGATSEIQANDKNDVYMPQAAQV